MQFVAAQATDFAIRLNADNPTEAARLLAELLVEAQKNGSKLTSLTVFDHAWVARPQLGGKELNRDFYDQVRSAVKGFGLVELHFLGCKIAEGVEGRAFASALAVECGLTVIAATKTVYDLEAGEIHRKNPSRSWESCYEESGRAMAFLSDGSTREVKYEE